MTTRTSAHRGNERYKETGRKNKKWQPIEADAEEALGVEDLAFERQTFEAWSAAADALAIVAGKCAAAGLKGRARTWGRRSEDARRIAARRRTLNITEANPPQPLPRVPLSSLPAAPSAPMRCKCGSLMRFAWTKQGRRLPVLELPVALVPRSDGRTTVVTRSGDIVRGEVVTAAGDAAVFVHGWPEHWSGCPLAGTFRKKKKGGRR